MIAFLVTILVVLAVAYILFMVADFLIPAFAKIAKVVIGLIAFLVIINQGLPLFDQPRLF